MTVYDDYPNHPLAGVSQDVLNVARSVVRDAFDWGSLDRDDAEPLADSVVSALVQAGYVKKE